MGNSLFDQLKSSGLVDDKKAKSARKIQYKNKKKKGKKGQEKVLSDAATSANKAKAEKKVRDRLLNLEQKNVADKRAAVAQIKQLIGSHRVDRGNADIAFNFVDAGVVKQVYISTRIQKSLIDGSVAIAKIDGNYELIPKSVANKIIERDKAIIILLNSSHENVVDESDPYANYEIPDDLMW